MHKKIFLLSFVSLVGAFSLQYLYAETIVLKTGKKVEGKIVEKTDKYVKLDFHGAILHYYLEDIDTIDGQPLKISSGNAESAAKDPYSNYLQGLEYAAKGNFKEAEVEFNKAYETNKIYHSFATPLKILSDFNQGKVSRDYVINLFTGIDYLEKKRYEDAIKEFEKAKEMNPNYSKVYTELGILYASLGQFQQAIDSYKKATTIDPSDAEAYSSLGVSFVSLGQKALEANNNAEAIDYSQQAVNYYQKAIQIKPDDFISYVGLGFCHLDLNKPEQAISYFQKAAQIEPNAAIAYDGLGSAYLYLSQSQEAKKNLEKAKELYGKMNDYQKVQRIDETIARLP
jgi:tetratricopeptide (TPR) repeat protein